jgi:hypothetical protein
VSGPALPLLAVVLVVTATIGIGVYGLRFARTTSDFLVASRSVSPLWNASAIGGEYLSAASFLGIAELIMVYGADALWYPVGFVAGYFVLLLFVAAPLRRSGAYTVPDFAEVRLGSQALRRLCAWAVVAIGLLYLVPQLHGAGLALRATTGAPVEAGAVLVAIVVTVNVAGGGMRSATFVQAFQYWLKLTALAVPAVFLLLAWQDDGRPELAGPAGPVFSQATTVAVDSDVTAVVEQPLTVVDDGQPRRLSTGPHLLEAGSTVVFPAGAAVPHVEGVQAATGSSWVLPLSGAGGTPHPLMPPMRSCWPPSWAPWACRTCWCASTPTRTDGRPGGRRWSCWPCWAPSTCSPRCTAPSAGCTCPSCCSPGAPMLWCWRCRSLRSLGRWACCSRLCWSPARSPRSCRRRPDCS